MNNPIDSFVMCKDITEQCELVRCNPDLTQIYVKAWKEMGISKDCQIKRISEWAEMLETRLAELDPDYKTYQFGRNT